MKTQKKGFSRPKKLDLAKAEAFIAGAEQNRVVIDGKKLDEVENKEPQKKMPWDKGHDQIMKGYNFRMNEILWLKLKYITENTPYSIQKFFESAITPAVEKELKKLSK